MLYYVATFIAGLGFLATQYLIFWQAPLAANLYFNQKIFYYHVPSAFAVFACVIALGIFSIRWLRSREARFDHWARACAQVAVLLGAIMLVTGSIWGKAAWDVWWQWDCLLYTSPSPRDATLSRMPSSA